MGVKKQHINIYLFCMYLIYYIKKETGRLGESAKTHCTVRTWKSAQSRVSQSYQDSPQSHIFTLVDFFPFFLISSSLPSLPCDWTQCVDWLWYWLRGSQAHWCDIWRGEKQISVSLLNTLLPPPAADEGKDWLEIAENVIHLFFKRWLSLSASLFEFKVSWKSL